MKRAKCLIDLDTLVLEAHNWRKPDARTLNEFALRLSRVRAAIAAEMQRLSTFGPDWSVAPEWARWWMADDQGVTFWSEAKPEMGSIGWLVDGESAARIAHATPVDINGVDWRATLRERPQAAQP